MATLYTSQIAKNKTGVYSVENDKDSLPLPKHVKRELCNMACKQRTWAPQGWKKLRDLLSSFLPRALPEAPSPTGRLCQQECCSWCWAATWQRIRAVLAGRPASGHCRALQINANASAGHSEQGSPAASISSCLPDMLDTGPWWGWVRQRWVCR